MSEPKSGGPALIPYSSLGIMLDSRTQDSRYARLLIQGGPLDGLVVSLGIVMGKSYGPTKFPPTLGISTSSPKAKEHISTIICTAFDQLVGGATQATLPQEEKEQPF